MEHPGGLTVWSWLRVLVGVAVVVTGGGFTAARATPYCDDVDLSIVARAGVDIGDSTPRVSGPWTNVNAVTCAVDADQDTFDARMLTPGATELAVRYTSDVEGAPEHLTGVLTGLGLNTEIHLDRFVRDVGGTGDVLGTFVVYEMANFVPIPGGATASGPVTATVAFPGGPKSVTFHTAL